MRVCLVTHGLPPYELTGVENYTLALARGLAAAGHQVEVFAARRAPELPDRSLRREARDGWAVTWVSANSAPRDPSEALDPPGIVDAFARFLDRERPELVHFQHVIKLGLGLIEAAQARGLPTVYTAHDYYPVCHRITLMRPDLSRCSTLADSSACTRCDLALSLLDRQPNLGDYQIGALPEQLEPAARDQLGLLLSGDEAGAGVHPDELRAARERRVALDARRREVLARLDRVLAPTEFLALQLVAGGVEGARVRRLDYGIDARDLLPLRRAAPAAAGRLRIGYLGGHSKHKGVHVLLEAWRRLAADAAPNAELSIWGGSSDAQYVAQLVASARTGGARWRGPYARAELPAILRELDLLVVPSIWVENQPFVIREALAAGRPVLASRVGALPENVREGVDGWLFEPGDALDLERQLRRLIASPELVRELAARLEPVKDLATHVRELEAHYQELASARPVDAQSAQLPEHVREPYARHAELAALPTRELYEHVLAGLEGLAPRLGARTPSLSRLLADAFGPRSRAQEFIDDGRGEHAWREQQHAVDASGLRALNERLSWRESLLAEREAELSWLRTSEQGLQAERTWLRETIDALERERNWLRDEHAAQRKELDWRVEQVGGQEQELNWRREQQAGLEKERDWLREEVRGRDFELGWLRGDLSAEARRLDEARGALEARLARCDALSREGRALLDANPIERSTLVRARDLLTEQARELNGAVASFLAALPRAPAKQEQGP
ncbi:MAG: glycosyltransferase [Planctomycetes bacterium]|nr:glycosyltransferase [Planctomycetota bacterium]